MTSSSPLKLSKTSFKAPRIVRVPSGSPKAADHAGSVFQVKSNRRLVFPISPKFDKSKLYAQHTVLEDGIEVNGVFYSCATQKWTQGVGADWDTPCSDDAKTAKGLVLSNKCDDFSRVPSLDFFRQEVTMCR